MPRISLKDLSSEVATLLGENLALEESPGEIPFPSIEERVRILAPAILAELVASEASASGFLEIPATLKAALINELLKSFTQ